MAEVYQDLLKDTSKSYEDGNYFIVTVTDLNPATVYPLEFKWNYKDGSRSDFWSAVKIVNTPGESEPNTPKFTSSNVNVTSPEKIIITWDGTSDDPGNPAITNYDRVDVYIDGYPFDGTKAAYSFKAPGTTTIAAPAGVYTIVLYAISKTNKSSPVSDPVTVTVKEASVPIETPTLPSNLSVTTAPFALAVNWDGTYQSNDTFTGFKSIDIYAVGSNLGSSVTSGITSTNLVGSLTVNDTTNRINIGLDNLRQALGLSTNSDVYNDDVNKVPQPWIYLYYNATNTKNEKYGAPTYTRINASPVVPTKANYIDLTSGIISIENLVAGNGQFASWLRAGNSAGARIELSSVAAFPDTYNSSSNFSVGITSLSVSSNTVSLTTNVDHGFTSGTSLTTSGIAEPSVSISSYSVSSNTVTINTPSAHNYSTGNSVTISNVAAAVNGTYTISVTGSQSFTYSKTASNIGNTGVSGSALRDLSGLNGTYTVSVTGLRTLNYTKSHSNVSLTNLSAGSISGRLAVTKGLAAYSSGGTKIFNLDLDSGSLTINGNGTFSGNLSAAGGSFTGSLNIGTSFSVSSTGVLSATAGTIGGWTLGSTYFQGNNIKLDTSGLTIGSTASAYLDISSTAMTHRNSNGTASNKFTLDFSTGSLTLGGTITAAANSTIGGWTAGSTYLIGGNMRLNSNGSITTGAGGTAGSFSVSASGVLTATGADISGDITANAVSTPNASITSAGDLTATGVDLSGKITASSGAIGGWKISSGVLQNADTGATTFLYPAVSGSSHAIISTSAGASFTHISATGSGTNLNAAGYAFQVTNGPSLLTGKTSFNDDIEMLPSGGSAGAPGRGRIFLGGAHTTTSNAANAFINSTTGNIARSTSSQRFKTNIESVVFSDNDIKLLNPVKFQGINDLSEGDSRYKLGFIAEEVSEISNLDLLVNYDDEGRPDSLNYDRFTVLIIDVIKRILNRLDALEA